MDLTRPLSNSLFVREGHPDSIGAAWSGRRLEMRRKVRACSARRSTSLTVLAPPIELVPPPKQSGVLKHRRKEPAVPNSTGQEVQALGKSVGPLPLILPEPEV